VSSESVTHWLGQLKAGNREAAQQLWDRYFQRLVELARVRLRCLPRALGDEEDAVLGAFDSFFRGVGRRQFPRLEDRHDLWKVLVVLTARKASDLARHENARKRGGGSAEPVDWEQLIGPEPTPEFSAQVAEEYRALLGRLGDKTLQDVAVWKLEGHTTEEIAGRLGCAPRTVERKLQVIRSIWESSRPAGP
jgi:DNA-directed RNA polymerase specialized sigma24 family protein